MTDVELEYGENDLSADEYKQLRKDVGWKEICDNQIQKSIDASDYIVTVRHKKKIVGMARCLTDGVYIAYIFDVVVASSYQKCGIGKKIMNQVLDHFREQQEYLMQIVLLAVNREVEGFYQTLGFKKYPNLLNGAGMGMWINGKPY